MLNDIEGIWECENGKTYICKEKDCLLCKHCTDVWYDWNGPYMTLCEIDAGGDAKECPFYEKED